jgi:hypothetical protein
MSVNSRLGAAERERDRRRRRPTGLPLKRAGVGAALGNDL